MKNVLKAGVLALALGLFVTACGPTSNNGNNQNSEDGVEQQAPGGTQDQPMPAEGQQNTPPGQNQPAEDTSSNDAGQPGGGM